MNKTTKYHKFDAKNKKKAFNYSQQDEERLSLKEVKREHDQKHFRNYENALRSKDVSALMQYEED